MVFMPRNGRASGKLLGWIESVWLGVRLVWVLFLRSFPSLRLQPLAAIRGQEGLSFRKVLLSVPVLPQLFSLPPISVPQRESLAAPAFP